MDCLALRCDAEVTVQSQTVLRNYFFGEKLDFSERFFISNNFIVNNEK